MSTVLVTGSAGFIGGYVVEELLRRDHRVIGLDNFSKYGPVSHSYDDDPRYRFVQGDARDVDLLTELLMECDHFIAGAALIGPTVAIEIDHRHRRAHRRDLRHDVIELVI